VRWDDPELDRVWNQNSIPVIARGTSAAPLLIKLPYREDNKFWLRNNQRSRPEWFPELKAWRVPRKWFEDLLRRALDRFGNAYVIQPFRESEKCAPACWDAVGATCECSCMGEHHGSGNPFGRWHIVSETFAIRWGPRKFSCRLLKPVHAQVSSRKFGSP
jgi:hypothetical protein